jgi:DNA-binding transcriptional LysR family regulator
MELHQLVYFEAVARHLHFTRAAEELHVAQPSVSAQIQKLEVELGATLFHRMARHVALTDAGIELLPRARGVLQQIEEARAAVQEVASLARGRLAIGAPPSVGMYLLPEVLASFNARYPGVTLVFREDGSRTLVQRLIDGELDLAVVIEPASGWRHPALETEALLEEALLLAVPPGHTLATMKSVGLAEVRDEPFVLLREGAYELREQTLAACRLAGFEPRVALDGGEMDSVLRLVAAGIGVTLLPETVLRGGHGGSSGSVGVRVTDVPLRRSLALARRKDRYESAAARAFVELLREMV